MALAHVNTTTAADASSGTTLDIARPSGSGDGDIVVLWIVADAPQATPSLSGSGWTRIGSGDSQGFLYYKTLGSSEPSTYTITWVGTSNERLAVLSAWSGGDAVSGLFSHSPLTGEGTLAMIGDPGTINAGSVAIGLRSNGNTGATFSNPVSDTWSPTWTSRGSTTGTDWTAYAASNAIASTVSPGDVYCPVSSGTFETWPRALVVITEAAEAPETIERSDTAGLIGGETSSNAIGTAGTDGAGLVGGDPSGGSTGEAGSGTAGAAIGANGTGTSGTAANGTAGLLGGASGTITSGDGLSVKELRRLVAAQAARLCGTPLAVSRTALTAARRVLNV